MTQANAFISRIEVDEIEEQQGQTREEGINWGDEMDLLAIYGYVVVGSCALPRAESRGIGF